MNDFQSKLNELQRTLSGYWASKDSRESNFTDFAKGALGDIDPSSAVDSEGVFQFLLDGFDAKAAIDGNGGSKIFVLEASSEYSVTIEFHSAVKFPYSTKAEKVSQVLSGELFRCEYTFAENEAISESLKFGALQKKRNYSHQTGAIFSVGGDDQKYSAEAAFGRLAITLNIIPMIADGLDFHFIEPKFSLSDRALSLINTQSVILEYYHAYHRDLFNVMVSDKFEQANTEEATLLSFALSSSPQDIFKSIEEHIIRKIGEEAFASLIEAARYLNFRASFLAAKGQSDIRVTNFLTMAFFAENNDDFKQILSIATDNDTDHKLYIGECLFELFVGLEEGTAIDLDTVKFIKRGLGEILNKTPQSAVAELRAESSGVANIGENIELIASVFSEMESEEYLPYFTKFGLGA